MKKIISLLLVIVLTATAAIGGTLAYLTDRDSEANVFTVGNVSIDLEEDFEQGATLIPGVEIEKKPTITNTGSNDAWVWLEFAIPSALDNAAQGTEQGSSENVIHWNPKGATTEGYVTEERVQAAINAGFFGEMDTTNLNAEYINENKMHWNVFNSIEDGKNMYTTEIEVAGEKVSYNVYVLLYNKALTPGETTLPNIEKVFLDARVDIDPDGNWSFVESGVATPISWNSETNGNPVIYVSAYAMQAEGFADARTAYAAYQTQWGDNGTEYAPLVTADTWDGTADTSWYNDTDTEFTLSTAEQLAGLAELVDSGNTFAGKTVKLGADINLYHLAEGAGEPTSFDPIGDDSPFAGTFDGQGHTIENLYQSGWAFGYEWGSYGSVGLFGELESATVKNLTVSGAESFVEGGDVGGITGSATGTCVFENITIEDSVFATYNNGNGGIIGWSGAGNYTFKNITIAEDTVLAGLWGSFDSSIGGVVGQGEPGATYNFENVDIACRLDVYNDCTASYDYYNYRMCGMIIGRLEKTTTINGTNYPDTSKYNITCKDVTVTYGDWANYHYCEPTPADMNGGRGMRVEAGYSYDGLPADYDHSQCVANHMNLIPFDQIFGGDQIGVKGLPSYDGVTVTYNNNQ